MLRNIAAATLLSSVCALTACSGEAPPPPPPATAAPSAPAPAAPLTYIPTAGNWTPSVDENQPTMTVDGSKAGATDPFPLAVAREIDTFRAGRLSVQFKLIGGKSDQIAGVVFNLKPDGSYNFARYNTKDGNVAIWRVVDGKREVLAHGEAHEQLALNQWHDLVVTIDGANVNAAAAGGRLTVAHTLPAPVDGKIGLWTKTDSVTAFRGLTVARP